MLRDPHAPLGLQVADPCCNARSRYRQEERSLRLGLLLSEYCLIHKWGEGIQTPEGNSVMAADHKKSIRHSREGTVSTDIADSDRSQFPGRTE
jgi:hypothetical protein